MSEFWMAIANGSTAVPKAIGKLVETVGTQAGLLLEPFHIRRKGQARADVLVAEARAKAEIEAIGVGNKLLIQDIKDRAKERVRTREERRQQNIDSITAGAAKCLPPHVSDEPVDEDWVAQFFNHCQDISNEQMQTIWSKILAGEVAKPGAFSLRTMGVVRVLSRDDAALFRTFCSTAWVTSNGLSPIVDDEETKRLDFF